eukprot:4196825-Pyramimonas_sp.AAC.1
MLASLASGGLLGPSEGPLRGLLGRLGGLLGASRAICRHLEAILGRLGGVLGGPGGILDVLRPSWRP